MTVAAHATASRWFRIWIGTWVAFIVTLFLIAPSGKLTSDTVIPSVCVHGALLALALYLAVGLRHGRRVGGATALVGFFALAGIAPVAVIAPSGGTP